MDETMDATDDFAVAESPIQEAETTDFVTDDLPDFSEDDFGGLTDEAIETTEDPAAVSPVEPVLTENVETAVDGSPLDNIDDSELLDFLGQDWRSNPEVAEITSLDEDGSEPILIQPLTEEELATLEEVEDMDDDWQPLGMSDKSFSGLRDLGFDTDHDEEEVPSFAAEIGGDDFDNELDDDWQPLNLDGTAATEMSSFALGELTNPDSPTGLLALELDDGEDDDAFDGDTFTTATETDFDAALDDADLDLAMADSPESFDDLDGIDLDETNLDQTNFDADLSMDAGDNFGDMDDFDDTDVELAMMEEEGDANMSGDSGSLGSLNDAVGNSDLDMESFDSSMDGLNDDLDGMDLDGLEMEDPLDLGADELDLLEEEDSIFGKSESEAIAPAADLLPDPFSEDNDTWLNDDLDPDVNALEDNDNDLGDMAIDPLGDLDLGDTIGEPDFSGDLNADMEMNLDSLDLAMDDAPAVNPFAIDALGDDELFSQDVMSSIQELDASTASLEADNFDLSDNSIFAGLEESIERDTQDHPTKETSMADLFSSDGELDLDMDSLALESSLELNDFSDFGGNTTDDLADFSFGDDLLKDLSTNEAIAPDLPNPIEDSLDNMDLDLGIETDDLMGGDSDFDNFDSPIDLAMDLDDDLPNFDSLDGDKDKHSPSKDDWDELENADINPSAADSWDKLQPTTTHNSTKTTKDAEDWTMDMGNLDALDNLEDADLSGLGDFDLESIEADDSDSDFDLFGDDSSDAFNPFIDTQA
jgi:hypothetical protein